MGQIWFWLIDWYFGSEIERGDETKKGDEYTEKEAEKERGDEIKRFHKTILQTQNLGRMVNIEGTEWGLGREKFATIREIGCVPIIGKVNVFVFFSVSFSFSNLGIEYNLGLNFLVLLV